MYEPTLKTTDLWHGVAEAVGELRHCALIDLVSAVRSPDDEELLLLKFGGHTFDAGHTEKEIGDILGISQQAVSYRLEQILRRSRERSRYVSPGRRSSRGTDLPPVLPTARNRRPSSGASN